jgi:hypothetical protein
MRSGRFSRSRASRHHNPDTRNQIVPWVSSLQVPFFTNSAWRLPPYSLPATMVRRRADPDHTTGPIQVACKSCRVRRVKCDADRGRPCWQCRSRQIPCEPSDSKRGRSVKFLLSSQSLAATDCCLGMIVRGVHNAQRRRRILHQLFATFQPVPCRPPWPFLLLQEHPMTPRLLITPSRLSTGPETARSNHSGYTIRYPPPSSTTTQTRPTLGPGPSSSHLLFKKHWKFQALLFRTS